MAATAATSRLKGYLSNPDAKGSLRVNRIALCYNPNSCLAAVALRSGKQDQPATSLQARLPLHCNHCWKASFLNKKQDTDSCAPVPDSFHSNPQQESAFIHEDPEGQDCRSRFVSEVQFMQIRYKKMTSSSS
ncbi:hypothetical protein O6H91_04G034300 [Diphasiastrum complanatum]|uniref:Uncharacterized protein n=1 Tax=Diphasiastrum complanatum TaxID=34168 RepID=A0ACC2DW25_DIPCM|nr:hypothetical protein O6H91_04G034300 [Diphasiastrum complanatum]